MILYSFTILYNFSHIIIINALDDIIHIYIISLFLHTYLALHRLILYTFTYFIIFTHIITIPSDDIIYIYNILLFLHT